MERLNEWFKAFVDIKKLTYEEAKSLLKQIKGLDDEQAKRELFNKVVLGTMYVIYDYLVKYKLYLAVNQDFDMDDLISSFTRQWISLLNSEDLEMFDSFDQVIDDFQLYYKSVIGISNDSQSITLDRGSRSLKRLFSLSEIRNIFKVYLKNIKEKGDCSVEDIKKAELNFDYENDELLEQVIETLDYLCQNDWNYKRNEKGILSAEDYHVILARLRNQRAKIASIFDQNQETLDNDDLEKIFKEGIVEDIISFLNYREQFIVVRYFGLYGQSKSTLEEIAEELGISRQRVCQIFDRIKIKIHGYLQARTKKEISFFDLVSTGRPLSRTQVHYLELDDDFTDEEIYVIKKLYMGEEEINKFEIQRNLQISDDIYQELIDTINQKLMRWKCSINSLDGYNSSLRKKSI